jgi:hypothetical protein
MARPKIDVEGRLLSLFEDGPATALELAAELYSKEARVIETLDQMLADGRIVSKEFGDTHLYGLPEHLR